MKAITAVDQNWAIGYQDRLLAHIPEDLKMFRAETEGKVVIYGRKCLLTFPDKKPLKNRVNIIFSRNPEFTVEDAVVVHDVEEMLEEVRKFDPQDVYVIGGGSIYRLLLDYCDEALVTKIEAAYTADTWFPNLDADPNWECVSVGDMQNHKGTDFHFDRYRRIRR